MRDAGALAELVPRITPAQLDRIVAAVVSEPHGALDDGDQLRFDFAPDLTIEPSAPVD